MPDPKTAPETEPMHYHLVAAMLVFLPEEEGAAPNVMHMNTVVKTFDGRVGVRSIGRAHQALQMAFFDRMQNPKLKVIDLIIQSISNLGVFLPGEFESPPKGMEAQEKRDMDEVLDALKKPAAGRA